MWSVGGARGRGDRAGVGLLLGAARVVMSGVGHVVRNAWRRLVALAALLLVAGMVLVALVEGEVWTQVGTGFIGGSVVGLVFAVAQYSLDEQVMRRQAAGDVRLTVTASNDLVGIGLGEADLSNAYLWRKKMASARLDRAGLVGADLREADLTAASMRGADLRRADLRRAELAEAVLDGADLTHARLDGGRLRAASLVGARLVEASISGPEVDGVGIDGSDRVEMAGAVLDRARLPRVVFTDLRAAFASGVGTDATGAVLREADLSCADLRGAGMNGADLRGIDLSGADLRGAVLAGADLRDARLVGTRLEHADLAGADLAGADLRRADLRMSLLTNVDLSAVDLGEAWVLPGDLARAAAPPDGDDRQPRIVTHRPESDDTGPGTAFVAREHSAGEPRPRRRPTTLVIVGSPPATAVASALARALHERMRGLGEANGSPAQIVLRDTLPYVGRPHELGLPDRVAVRRCAPELRWWPWRRRIVRVELGPGPTEDTVRCTVTAGRGPTAGPDVVVALDGGARAAEDLATQVQWQLAEGAVFSCPEVLGAFSRWLGSGGGAPSGHPEEVLALDPRNAVGLLLQGWSRPLDDAAQAVLASDEARIAWGASEPGPRRAMAATLLGQAQCQLAHRTSMDQSRIVATARAAGDAALAALGPADESLGRRRHVALRSRAEHARTFAAHVTEAPDALDEGIGRYRSTIGRLERLGLPVSSQTRNNLAYCLMTRVGRFTTGPGLGYDEAMKQLRLVLDHHGIGDDAPAGEAGPAAAPPALTVAELAERSAAGQGPPDDPRLRTRSLRLALANMGNLHRLTKRFDRALACYGAALWCQPSYLEAYGERAWVRLEQNDLAGAEADVDRALATSFGTGQQKARIVMGYVDALGRVGRTGEQGRWIERACRLDPAYAQATRRLREWRTEFDAHTPDPGSAR